MPFKSPATADDTIMSKTGMILAFTDWIAIWGLVGLCTRGV